MIKKACSLLALVVASALLSGTVNAFQFDFQTSLSGLQEAPPNASPGYGSATVTYDDVLHTLRVQVSFADLVAPTTFSHIHAATAIPFTGTAGVATTTPTLAGFPAGVTTGTYDNTLDLTQASSYRAAFITANGGTTAGAEAALVSALMNGQAYLNIHTTTYGGGEIRGFLTRVPDGGSSLALLGLGLAGMSATRRLVGGMLPRQTERH